ncbi:DUF2461 domain-containing protein [Polluticaenibacter yanchengensis]|uniref:DUF2461 domain-containing protein n=1 Tax=Polluticaenibacter yanchengensis TaxID=3014562 RepID=A0ABT4UMY1_9BACT|nr:DUF2461 domain-containing protein [Chitinophagaceae bacterium LY-5]
MMIEKSTIAFLKQLSENNNKPWFDANRKTYEQARANFAEVVQSIINQLAVYDPTIGHIEAKSAIYRINRDIRFSNDKTPYKTHFGMYFTCNGKVDDRAGYYMHITPGSSFIGGGLWMPLAPDLKKIRQEIDYNLEEFKSILENPAFVKHYKKLDDDAKYKISRPPKGYEADNPAIEYLKFKSFTASTTVSDKQALSADFVKNAVDIFKALTPLNTFFNKALAD